MQCWAKPLGNCGGGQSAEHYFTQGLADRELIGVQAAPFSPSAYKWIPLTSARAKTLCRFHNTALSRVDQEAIRLKQILCEGLSKVELVERSNLWRGPTAHKVSGVLFSRWITKVYCNMSAMDRQPVDLDFVKHSFGCATERALHFYTIDSRGVHGLASDFEGDIYGCHFRADDWRIGVHVRLLNTNWVAANFDCKERELLATDRNSLRIETRYMAERPQQIGLSLPLGHEIDVTTDRVLLDW